MFHLFFSMPPKRSAANKRKSVSVVEDLAASVDLSLPAKKRCQKDRRTLDEKIARFISERFADLGSVSRNVRVVDNCTLSARLEKEKGDAILTNQRLSDAYVTNLRKLYQDAKKLSLTYAAGESRSALLETRKH